MTPSFDPAVLSQAVSLIIVVSGLMVLLTIVKTTLDIIAFFRRQPSIDQVIAQIQASFREQLDLRVSLHDFERSEQRMLREISCVEQRCLVQIRDAEARTENRLSGMHEAIVDVRKGQTDLLTNIQQLVKDMRA